MSTDVQNAIFASSKAGYEDDIKELLANPKVDWKAKDGLGNTPLHYAAGILSLFIQIWS
jgi:ankyrin repeat protein